MKEPIIARLIRTLALEGNVRVLAITDFLFGAYQGMLRVIWQPFVLSLGASVSVLGMLESLGGRMGVVGPLVQPLGGWLADRLGRKPLMVVASLVTAASLVLFGLAAVLGTWLLLIPGVVLMGLGELGRSLRLTVTAESANHEQRGMAFSAVTFFFIVPGIVAPAAGGLMAERWGFLGILLAGILLEILILVLVLRFLRETITRHSGRLHLVELRGVLARVILPPRGMRGLYLALSMDTFVWGVGSGLLFGLLTEAYGFTPAQLGVLASLLSLSWAVMQLPIGRLIDRYGCKTFLILSELLGLVTYGMWLSLTSFYAFALSYLMMGLVAATWVPAMTTLLANSVAQEERGEAMGRLFAFRGLIRFPAPVLSSLLYTWGGFRAPLLAGLVGVAGVTLLIAWLVREPARSAVVV